MKKILCVLLCAAMLLSVVACGNKIDSKNYDPSSAAKKWMETQIKNNTLISFDFDGKAYTDHIKNWDKTVEDTEEGWTVTYKKDGVIAWSEISFDSELAALEWTNYFKNEGSSDSAVISNILAINSEVSVENPILTTANGSDCAANDFEPIVVDLVAETEYTMATHGGRSSQGAFPYFDISNGEYGVIGAIGWSGDWKADFVHEEGKISIVAGMQKTNISLHVNEQMRTPMIMIQFFKGTQDDGHNALRRLMFKSYVPKEENGDPARIPQVFTCDGQDSEEAQISLIKIREAEGRDIEGMWIDASWYGELGIGTKIGDGEWIQEVGNWYFNPERFPEGNMLKTGTWLEEQGKDFIVWFEPERVNAGTQLATEHPEWMLKSNAGGSMYLFDLRNDEACDYLIDMISGIIQGSKITWYRQDFNINPSSYWTEGDENENRVGMSEIQYITNLYRYWDGLVEKNPGLMIDNCASGGRRLDLELMSRSVPLWRSDYNKADLVQTDAIRSINFDLTWWIPLHGGRYPNENPTKNGLYNMRCMLSAGGMTGYNGGIEVEAQQALAENKVNREMMYGDYYMLSYGVGNEVGSKNAAYQFNVPDEGKGYILTFRPVNSEKESSIYKLKGLEADATYKIDIVDSNESFTATGAELMEKGIACWYPDVAFSILIYYNKV